MEKPPHLDSPFEPDGWDLGAPKNRHSLKNSNPSQNPLLRCGSGIDPKRKCLAAYVLIPSPQIHVYSLLVPHVASDNAPLSSPGIWFWSRRSYRRIESYLFPSCCSK